MSYIKVKLNHIALKALEVGHKYLYPIFYKDKANIYKKLIDIDQKYENNIKEKIKNLQIKDLFILTKDSNLYEKDTQEYLTKLLLQQNISVKLKSEIVHEMTIDTMYQLFNNQISKSKINRSKDLINDSINLLLSDNTAVDAMLGVTSYDYYTYTHCVNVSIYAIAFGHYLKLNKQQLLSLGMGALLHDIGKLKIPNEIVNKNGKLTDEEFKIMEQHPIFGVKVLEELGETNKDVLQIIEQHHEKIDGSGYPNNLEKEMIYPLSQIVTIADIFDALTTKRSYKEALTSYRALIIMQKEMKNEINQNLLKEFISFMDKKR